MKALRFSIAIEAPRTKVWDKMLHPDSYRIWTAEFMPGSYFEGSWETGERIRFLAPGGDGMTSIIADNRRPEFLSIKHLGIIKNGIDDTDSDAARKWAPAYENYTLVDVDVGTQLDVTLEVSPEFEAFLLETWPKALARLKAICEAKGK